MNTNTPVSMTAWLNGRARERSSAQPSGPLGVPLAALLDFSAGAVAADEGFEGVLLHTERGESSTSEVYLLRVAAGVSRESPAHAAGAVEQLVVLAGSCRLEYADAVVDVPTGGHASWPADVPHRYTATGADDLRAVNVIATPR